MSGGIEVKKPIRFFFFFGLFLAFVLLGVRACNERRTLEEVAEVEKILSENKRDLIPSKESLVSETPEGKELNVSNSDELGDFEPGGPKPKPKPPKKTTLKVNKNKAQAVINVRPKKEDAKKIVKKVEKPKSKKVEFKAPPKQAAAEKKSDSTAPKMKILVSGQGYALDGVSQAKLKGAIKLNSNPSKVKVLLFANDSQGRSLVVKRAELKSSLIRAGLSTSVDIDFEIVERSGYAEILFY